MLSNWNYRTSVNGVSSTVHHANGRFFTKESGCIRVNVIDAAFIIPVFPGQVEFIIDDTQHDRIWTDGSGR
jgi:hypothetical protein